MNVPVGAWILIGSFLLFFVLPFVAYLIGKYAQMGKLAGTRSFLSFRSDKER